MIEQNNTHHLHFVKVVVWKRDKILVELQPTALTKYDLPTFLVGSTDSLHDTVRNEMRKAFRMSVGDIVDTGIKVVNRTAMGGDKPAFVHIDYIACDHQSIFKDTLLTVEPPLSLWVSARVAHALFVKDLNDSKVDGHIQYLSKFL